VLRHVPRESRGRCTAVGRSGRRVGCALGTGHLRLEGAGRRYVPGERGWVKVKNPAYWRLAEKRRLVAQRRGRPASPERSAVTADAPIAKARD
jgi:hypothetical protein